MTPTISFLQTHTDFLASHLAQLEAFLSDANVQKVAFEYRDKHADQEEEPLNVFTMASDLYYRENFHSDIIRTFLDTTEKHKQGTRFLFAFIDFLNQHFHGKVNISKADYQHATADREQGRIDIRIIDEETKHCIIIENKINNAGDMQRQLPRYFEYMADYHIDAMVYLPLDEHKQPDQSTWSQQDKDNVLPLLCHCPAYAVGLPNLVDGWLMPCTTLTNDINCISILRQYADLIKTLHHNNMDSVIMEKFYNELKNKNNYESAISVRNMLNEMPKYMTDRLLQHFGARGEGYEAWTGPYRGLQLFVVRLWINGDDCRLHVHTEGCKYNIEIGNLTDQNRMDWFSKLESTRGWNFNGWGYNKEYAFDQETAVIAKVTEIIAEMRPLVDKNQ